MKVDIVIERSASGEFVAFERCGEVLIGRDCDRCYPSTNYPIAKLSVDYEVIGIRGNSGDRFEKLTPVEKMDIGTLVTRMMTRSKR